MCMGVRCGGSSIRCTVAMVRRRHRIKFEQVPTQHVGISFVQLVVETASDVADILVSADEWPFQARCEELCNDLFHPQWEYRHGYGATYVPCGLHTLIIMVHMNSVGLLCTQSIVLTGGVRRIDIGLG